MQGIREAVNGEVNFDHIYAQGKAGSAAFCANGLANGGECDL
jgi:hypothetical protein